MIWFVILILFGFIVLGGIFVIMNWYRTDTLENRIDKVEQELKRNYELDEHQESSINYLRTKDE